jgi:hypothetical protein
MLCLERAVVEDVAFDEDEQTEGTTRGRRSGVGPHPT